MIKYWYDGDRLQESVLTALKADKDILAQAILDALEFDTDSVRRTMEEAVDNIAKDVYADVMDGIGVDLRFSPKKELLVSVENLDWAINADSAGDDSNKYRKDFSFREILEAVFALDDNPSEFVCALEKVIQEIKASLPK